MGHGAFSGEPVAVWLTEQEPDRHMQLTADFWFDDPNGKRWHAPAKMRTDGASIPPQLWWLVGSPYTGDYRRAALVHDQACVDSNGDRKKRREADRMFYHACRAGGCSVRDATVLYVGVRVGALMDRFPKAKSSTEALRPHLMRSEGPVEQIFRETSEQVLQPGEVDDVDEIENRTDAALTQRLGIGAISN